MRSVLVAVLLLATGPIASAQSVELGAAESFAVLGGSTVTSTGVSAVTGDLGVSPGTAVTGFPPGTIATGSLHAGDEVATAAHAGLAGAYADAVALGPEVPITGDLGGQTLTPGVYAAGAALTLAGTVTLDAEDDPNAVFILKAGSTLGTAAGSAVALSGGAQACNVFWLVGSSATLGATSFLSGTLMATTSISMGDGVIVDGRVLARDGAVTMVNDAVTVPACDRSVSVTAPAFAPFTATLTGLTQTVHTSVGAWSVTDATESAAGYVVTVSASSPTVDGLVAGSGTGASLTLTPAMPTAAAGNTALDGPVASSPQLLGAAAATIQTAAAGTGQGRWEFAADTGEQESLAILIPGDASAGAYSSTLTFTTAPLVAP